MILSLTDTQMFLICIAAIITGMAYWVYYTCSLCMAS